MQRLTLVPEAFLAKTAITDRWLCLFDKLEEGLGFKTQAIENLGSIYNDTKLILTCTAPRLAHINERLLKSLKPNVRFIVFIVDTHKRDVHFDPHVERLLKRADCILGTDAENFKESWPRYANKHIFFPTFFAPYERYAGIPFNLKPKMKCLLSGAISEHYPLRQYIVQEVNKNPEYQEMVDILPHPGTQGADKVNAVVREDYAKILNSYFCAIATPALKCVVSRYFEIPAVGTLLLAEQVRDFDRLGFVPYRHYGPIAQETVFKRIKNCLANPERFADIRRQTMEMVRENHGIDNRVEQFNEILKGL